jgi:hypothetical protein
MANRRTFPERRSYVRQAYERWLMGRGILRRRALWLIMIGLVFTFMAGVNLDVFDATVGCVAVAAGGAWFWCLGLGQDRRARVEYSVRDATVGRGGKLYSEKAPATRRDPHFP